MFFFVHKADPSRSVKESQVDDIEDSLFSYTSENHHFTAGFPVVPHHVSGGNADEKTGDTIGYEVFVAKSRLGTTYMLSIVSYPESFDVRLPQKVLKNALDEIVAGDGKNVVKTSCFSTYQGFPSLDYVVENPLAEVKGKAVLKGHTLYVISVAHENKGALEQHFEKFLSSFSFSEQ